MASSGSHRLRTLLIVIVVLAVLLVVADRVSLHIAESTAADNIASSQNLPSKPNVDVSGFPFLTQLASGSYDQITVTSTNVPIAQSVRELDISSVRVVLNNLDVSDNFSTFHAKTATATATVDYAALSKTLGVDLSYAGNGTIRTSKTVTLAGRSVTATITTRPTLVNGALSFASSTVNGASSLGQSITDTLMKVFDLKIPLSGIPFELRVTGLRVGTSGLTVSLAGSNLTYTK